MVESQRLASQLIITLRPNRSANWQQTKQLIACVGLFVLFIAMLWSLVGVWLILPFAGLEVSLLAYLLYRGSYDSYQKQVITIDSHSVIFAAGVYSPRRWVRFDRDDVSVQVKDPQLPMDHCQLSLCDPHLQMPFGQFLNQDDRLQAISCLQQAGLFVQRNKWWRQH